MELVLHDNNQDYANRRHDTEYGEVEESPEMGFEGRSIEL